MMNLVSGKSDGLIIELVPAWLVPLVLLPFVILNDTWSGINFVSSMSLVSLVELCWCDGVIVIDPFWFNVYSSTEFSLLWWFCWFPPVNLIGLIKCVSLDNQSDYFEKLNYKNSEKSHEKDLTYTLLCCPRLFIFKKNWESKCMHRQNIFNANWQELMWHIF